MFQSSPTLIIVKLIHLFALQFSSHSQTKAIIWFSKRSECVNQGSGHLNKPKSTRTLALAASFKQTAAAKKMAMKPFRVPLLTLAQSIVFFVNLSSSSSASMLNVVTVN